MSASKDVNLPDLSQACTLTIRNPFVIEGADGAVTFCREPRDASEKQLQLRILARCCPDPVQLVPLELRDLKRWVCWKLELDHDTGKIKKPPYSPRTGQPIAATVKYIDHFVTFAEAHTACKKFGLNGVGFVFVASDGFVGIDVDHAVEDGIINADVEVWLKNWFAETYQEFSPSGRGIHILGRGTIAEAVKAPLPNAPGVTVEIYSTDRYFTFTSQRISDSNAVTECQLQLGKLLAELNVKTLRENQGDDRPRTMLAIRRGFEKLMVDFAALTRPEDAQNDMLNKCSYYASRSFLAGALSGTEAEIQERLRAVARATKYCPGIEPTLKSGWKNGVVAGAFAVLDESRALADTDAWLADDSVSWSNEQAAETLALLTEEEYEARRKKASSKLGIRPTMLDSFVKKRRPKAETELQGSEVIFEPTEPWHEPVDGAKLLVEIEKMLHRFIAFHNPHDASTVTLWVAGAHCYDAFNIFPRLGIVSPERECGKTTLLDIIKCLVPRAQYTSNLTTATAFRIIDLYKPTLLVDEFDTFIQDHPELVGVLNSGHKSGAFVLRCVGDDQQLRRFATFGPLAYGQIGYPPGTLMSRSLLIWLLRRAPNVKMEDFDVDENSGLLEELTRLRQKLARWTDDSRESVKSAQPDTSGLSNRTRNNWRPLLKLANVAGGDWPDRARRAASVPIVRTEESDAIRVLHDIWNIFKTRGIKHIPYEILVCDLLLQKESGWSRYHNDREPLDVRDLAKLLRTLGIESKNLSISLDEQSSLYGTTKVKRVVRRGYERDQFVKMVEMFLTDEQEEVVEVSDAKLAF